MSMFGFDAWLVWLGMGVFVVIAVCMFWEDVMLWIAAGTMLSSDYPGRLLLFLLTAGCIAVVALWFAGPFLADSVLLPILRAL